jgi:hypothetical protein
MSISIIIPSIRLGLAKEAQKSLYPFNSVIKYSGIPANSFSKLINECILKADSEIIIIICNDKIRAIERDIVEMVDLILFGYGIVALDRFNFFGFKKEVIRRIGFFDERYVGGGFEDWDMIRRLKESNIAYYEISGKIKCLNLPTTWQYGDNINFCPAAIHLKNKWGNNVPPKEGKIERFVDEEFYNYDIGPSIKTNFLPWVDSVLCSWRKYECVQLS